MCGSNTWKVQKLQQSVKQTKGIVNWQYSFDGSNWPIITSFQRTSRNKYAPSKNGRFCRKKRDKPTGFHHHELKSLKIHSYKTSSTMGRHPFWAPLSTKTSMRACCSKGRQKMITWNKDLLSLLGAPPEYFHN